MGYRGSKSETINKHPQPNLIYNSVKEQRVDGSSIGQVPMLRCTLMGFARNYQVKILSKQFNISSPAGAYKFSSSAYSKLSKVAPCLRDNTKLNPWFVTGFCDAESTFSVSIYIDKRFKPKITE